VTLLAGRAITKSFGSRLILDGADLTIEPHARIGVVGPNGSGTSTLLKILAGLDRMTRVLTRQEEALERFEAAGGPGAEGRSRAALLELRLQLWPGNYFLDRVADRIVEVDGSVRATDGGYSAWLERRSGATG